MGKNSEMPEGIKTTMYWVLGIGIIALIGLILLILFGNLSGNLGFSQDTNSSSNETINLTSTGSIPASAANKIKGTLASILITNATGGELVDSTNYTITGVTINSSAPEVYFEDHNVNVSYTVSYDSQLQIDSEGLIINYTTSVVNTGKQFPTVGTIVGVALLLIVLLGILIFAIKKMMNVTEGGGGGSLGEGKTKRFGGDDSAGIA